MVNHLRPNISGQTLAAKREWSNSSRATPRAAQPPAGQRSTRGATDSQGATPSRNIRGRTYAVKHTWSNISGQTVVGGQTSRSRRRGPRGQPGPRANRPPGPAHAEGRRRWRPTSAKPVKPVKPVKLVKPVKPVKPALPTDQCEPETHPSRVPRPDPLPIAQLGRV